MSKNFSVEDSYFFDRAHTIAIKLTEKNE